MRCVSEDNLRYFWKNLESRLNAKLDKTEQARDSAKLGGFPAEDYVRAQEFVELPPVLPDPPQYPHATLTELAQSEGPGEYLLETLSQFADIPTGISSTLHKGLLTVEQFGQERLNLILQEVGTANTWNATIALSQTSTPDWAKLRIGSWKNLGHVEFHPDVDRCTVMVPLYNDALSTLSIYARDIQFKAERQSFAYNERLFEIDNSKFDLFAGVMSSHHMTVMVGRGGGPYLSQMVVFGRSAGIYGTLAGKPVIYAAVRQPFEKTKESGNFPYPIGENDCITWYMDTTMVVIG
jgi:hypothetical protein